MAREGAVMERLSQALRLHATDDVVRHDASPQRRGGHAPSRLRALACSSCQLLALATADAGSILAWSCIIVLQQVPRFLGAPGLEQLAPCAHGRCALLVLNACAQIL